MSKLEAFLSLTGVACFVGLALWIDYKHVPSPDNFRGPLSMFGRELRLFGQYLASLSWRDALVDFINVLDSVRRLLWTMVIIIIMAPFFIVYAVLSCYAYAST